MTVKEVKKFLMDRGITEEDAIAIIWLLARMYGNI